MALLGLLTAADLAVIGVCVGIAVWALEARRDARG